MTKQAQNNKSQAENERFDDRYKKELGFGRYFGKQVVEFVVSFGSMGLGAFLGSKLMPRDREIDFSQTIENRVRRSVKTRSLDLDLEIDSDLDLDIDNTPRDSRFTVSYKTLGAIVGGIVGATIGGIILGYGKWKKKESERLAVGEINDDIANIKIRQRTDEELIRENNSLREMYREAVEQRESVQHETSNSRQSIQPKSHFDFAEADANVAYGRS